MTHPFFSELNETLICEHKTNSWNTDDTTPYHCHDGYEILVFIGGHASFFVENDGKILEPGDIVCCPPGAFHRAMQMCIRDRPMTKRLYCHGAFPFTKGDAIIRSSFSFVFSTATT